MKTSKTNLLQQLVSITRIHHRLMRFRDSIGFLSIFEDSTLSQEQGGLDREGLGHPQSELLRTNYVISDMACLVYESTGCIRYGRMEIGTARWQCKVCRYVSCHFKVEGVLAFSELSENRWIRFDGCFADHIPI